MFPPILLSLASLVAAQYTGSACSQIAHSYEVWTKNGGNGDLINIPGQTAHDCLMSMPFDSARAVQFIDEYLKHVQFQSTLDSLKHPPPGYITPSIDLLKGFSKIRNKAVSNTYKSQYEFDNAIKSLIHRANEGHLEIHLCSHQVFRFHRSPPLVSISSDGLELPNIYTWDDVKRLRDGGSEKEVSHLAEINGVDATYFLQAHLGIQFEYHDPDARYNHLFPFPGNQFTGFFTGGGWTSYQGLWPGASRYDLKFSNGSTLTVTTTAMWPGTNGPMNYTDGEGLWKAACLPGYEPSLMSFYHLNVPPPPRLHVNQDGGGEEAPSKEGIYPDPIVRTERDSIRGYYLDTAPQNDTAVLQIPTFQHTGGVNFSQTALDFLTLASQRDGKTKLIIDLSGNTGGDVIPGFNVFKILFPDLPIMTATRFRATEIVKLMGKVYSEVYYTPRRDVNFDDEKSKEEQVHVPIDPPFVASVAVGPDQDKRRFPGGWEDLFGPFEGNMSSLLSHFDLDLASTKQDPIYGYGPFASMATTSTRESRPFRAEDIVVITNSQCASTCALLISLLCRQAGVRTLAFGGRPRYAPMQPVGGVKGGQYWSLGTIHRHVSRAIELAVNSFNGSSSDKGGTPILTGEELARLKELAPADPDPDPRGRRKGFPLRMGWQGEGGVNFRDLYYLDDLDGNAGDENKHEGGGQADTHGHDEEKEKEKANNNGNGKGQHGASKDTVHVPAQFIYEPAECRRFFTAEMMFRPASMWEVAREVMFGNNGECVEGSETGHGSGRRSLEAVR
ncbi:hypothetical protein QBC32DRAFT_400400 [Pseudoneurospora amorphoporcata]|uniref:Tail specific protease domain-containing protein n=1 Tax=Pseudoneurospora amorphoporcata TaxID=241081 RepID=A0AAN6SD38_9PEZI|nr:hypothetical protein QBC32DRAFT_400400 [Pseudoneurospora amorphoporcata]